MQISDRLLEKVISEIQNDKFEHPRKLAVLISEVLCQKELKIGIDTGVTVCRIASLFRERFFVGVEFKTDKCEIAIIRSRESRLKNLAIVNMEAYRLLAEYIPSSSFTVVHVYFPTPPDRVQSIGLSSPLFSKHFVNEIHRILETSGEVRLVTDVRSYYDLACSYFLIDKWKAVDWQPIQLGQPRGYIVGTPTEIAVRNEPQTKIYKFQALKVGK